MILSKEKKILCVGKLKMELIAADIYQILEIAHLKWTWIHYKQALYRRTGL